MSKQVFISPIDESFLTERDTLGDLRWEGNRCYKYVKLRNMAGTISADVGDKVLYAEPSGYPDNIVVIDAIDGSVGAGVISAPAEGILLTDYYMWIQIKGPVFLSLPVGGGATDGDAFIASGNNKSFALAGATSKPVCGVLISILDNNSASLDCPF